MSTRLLVPMDASEMAEQALVHALETYPDPSITVLHVVAVASPMMGKIVSVALEDDIEAIAEEQASEVFDRARDVAAEYDVTIDTAVGYGKPAREILDRAEDYDMVVLGSHGGSLMDRLLVGNVANDVVRRSPVPVTVVR